MKITQSRNKREGYYCGRWSGENLSNKRHTRGPKHYSLKFYCIWPGKDW